MGARIQPQKAKKYHFEGFPDATGWRSLQCSNSKWSSFSTPDCKVLPFFTHFLKFNDTQVFFTKEKKKVIFLDKYIQDI
jgi:hypothetical protein